MTATAAKLGTLEYIKTIGVTNNGDNGRGFANPYSIAIDSSGNSYVINRCDPVRARAIRASVQDFDENFLFEFSEGYGSGPGQFVLPVAVAFSGDDELYITDEHNNRVVVYDAKGKFLTQWGQGGSEPHEFDGPAGIAIDSSGNVYVADQGSNSIKKFTSTGEHVSNFGSDEDGRGLNQPWGIGIDDGDNIYVADWRNDLVKKFASDGTYLETYGGGGDVRFNRPSGVAVDSEGYIYVTDWGNERLCVLTPDGLGYADERGRATLSKWAIDYFSSNPDETTVRDKANLIPDLPPEYSNDPYHVSSQTEPYFWGPVAVTVDNEDRVYVVESNRHRIQIYKRS